MKLGGPDVIHILSEWKVYQLQRAAKKKNDRARKSVNTGMLNIALKLVIGKIISRIILSDCRVLRARQSSGIPTLKS